MPELVMKMARKKSPAKKLSSTALLTHSPPISVRESAKAGFPGRISFTS